MMYDYFHYTVVSSLNLFKISKGKKIFLSMNGPITVLLILPLSGFRKQLFYSEIAFETFSSIFIF